MTIREATDRDAPGIAAILITMEISALASHSLESIVAIIAQNLSRAATSNSTALVAESPQGEITGYCAVHWVPFLFMRGGEAYVTELFIRRSDSGKGVGTMLLDTIVASARRRGCSRLSLLNGRDSDAYRRGFYAKNGWTERDRMANFILRLT